MLNKISKTVNEFLNYKESLISFQLIRIAIFFIRVLTKSYLQVRKLPYFSIFKEGGGLMLFLCKLDFHKLHME